MPNDRTALSLSNQSLSLPACAATANYLASQLGHASLAAGSSHPRMQLRDDYLQSSILCTENQSNDGLIRMIHISAEANLSHPPSFLSIL